MIVPTWKIWLSVLQETLWPSLYSFWLCIILPLAVAGFSVWAMRGRIKGAPEAWKATGRAWKMIGLTLAGTSLLAFLAVPLIRLDVSRQHYYQRMIAGSSRIQSGWDKRRRLEALYRFLPETDESTEALRKKLEEFADKLDGDARNKFILSFYNTTLKKPVIFYYEPLLYPESPALEEEVRRAFPEEWARIKASRAQATASTGAQSAVASMPDSRLTREQIAKFAAKDNAALNRLLSKSQWAVLRHQLMGKLDRDELRDMTLTLVLDDFLQPPADEDLMLLVTELVLETTNVPVRLYLHYGERLPLFVFQFLHYAGIWLRDLPWFLIYAGVGLYMARQGGVMESEGQRPIFPRLAKTS